MPFNSYSFLLLLIPVVALFWALPAAWRGWYVFAVSLAYYAAWSLVYVWVPLLLCAAVSFAASRGSRWQLAGITFVLATLILFRSPLFPSAPAGISFYSFAAIAYLLDARQGRIRNQSASSSYRFLMFWPAMISGPILRFRELGPQLGFTKPLNPSLFLCGLDRLTLGLVQKNFIANPLSGWVNEGFLPGVMGANTTVDSWALAVAFGLEVYFDFMAYSNMALGAALLMGVTLPENFRFPYHAANPADFWGRWHMTLSRWIRDYLFFPVNAKFKGSSMALCASLVGIMALVGLWHGARWGFLVWGAMHGCYLVLYRVWESLRNTGTLRGASRAVSWSWRLFTLVAVTAAWVPFRAGTLSGAWAMLGSMFGRWRFGVSYGVNFYLVTLLVAAYCLVEPWVGSVWSAFLTRLERSPASLMLLRPLAYAAGLLIFLIFDDRNTQFIYFQF